MNKKSSPLNQSIHDMWSQDSNIKNEDERKLVSDEAASSFATGAAHGAAFLFPWGRVAQGVGKGINAAGQYLTKSPQIKKVVDAFANTSKQYTKVSNNTAKNIDKVSTADSAGNVASEFKNVPIVGTSRSAQVPASSSTQAVSYVNPRISMTAAERLKAGYSVLPAVFNSVFNKDKS